MNEAGAFAITRSGKGSRMVSEVLVDDDFEARVRSSFARQKMMTTIGAELTLVTRGTVEIEMPFSEALTQQHGFLHADVISTALDSACGYAAFSLMPPDAAVLTIEFKVNLLAPARGQLISAVGNVKRPGKTLTVCSADAFADGKLCATMLATIIRVPNS